MADAKQTEHEDQELIRRIAAKDADALDSFYKRYNRIAFTLVFRIVVNRDDAEDVLVEVFWQVWQQATRYDPSRGKPIAWLLTIARTRALDCLRARGRTPVNTGEPEATIERAPASSDGDPFVLADTRQAVQAALQTLPEQHRIPIEMSFFQGMSHTEIATALGQPLGTVKDRVRNGMMHLKKRLKPYL
jgi:RNA polymerase sigma-70 factor (ECF subfamily)